MTISETCDSIYVKPDSLSASMCGEQTQRGNYTMHGVTISELIEKMKLRNTTPEIDTDKIVLTHPDVNRPALQLTGFFRSF